MSKKPPAKDDIGIKLAALALIIADKASDPDVLLPDRLDAFKALTAYHIGTVKANAKRDTGEDDEGASFNGFRDRITAASSGNGSGDTGHGDDSLFG